MSPIKLETPFLDGGIRSINFFNGRLLSGEDLSQEKAANLLHLRQLGLAIGDGIAYGMEVSETPLVSTSGAPVVTVQAGLAINRLGQTLALPGAVNVSILPGAAGNGAGQADAFAACKPPQTGVYTAGAGLYLLTIAPAQGSEGRAPVNGLGNSSAACNTRYEVEGVQFRVLSLTGYFTAELQEPARLRNLVAHRCLGTADANLKAAISNPFGPPPEQYGLLDELRPNCLADEEVPLAVLYWETSGGIQFIDRWAVRRTLVRRQAFSGERRRAETDAMFRQFEEQIEELRAAEANLASVAAAERFAFLPPAGAIPIQDNGSPAGFAVDAFFGGQRSRDIAFLDGDRLRSLLHTALSYDPIDLKRARKIQLYRIWENVEAAANGATAQAVLVFASETIPFTGVARYGYSQFGAARATNSVL